MASALDKLYLVKDLSRLTGHSVYTIKYYLKLGLIHESGRSPVTRFRYFDDAAIERLQRIRAWRREQRSLRDIADLLRSGDAAPQAAVGR